MERMLLSLCYDVPHLKTAQVFHGLQNTGKFEIDFLLVPHHRRMPRDGVFQHRPQQNEGCGATEIALANGLRLIPYSAWRSVVGEALANTDATPGGGSAAAISGSMGCGLAEMAIGITMKSKYIFWSPLRFKRTVEKM